MSKLIAKDSLMVVDDGVNFYVYVSMDADVELIGELFGVGSFEEIGEMEEKVLVEADEGFVGSVRRIMHRLRDLTGSFV